MQPHSDGAAHDPERRSQGEAACRGAPWVTKAEDVAAFGARKRSTGSVTSNPTQQTFEFQ